mgnify:CR=1 FL=1
MKNVLDESLHPSKVVLPKQLKYAEIILFLAIVVAAIYRWSQLLQQDYLSTIAAMAFSNIELFLLLVLIVGWRKNITDFQSSNQTVVLIPVWLRVLWIIATLFFCFATASIGYMVWLFFELQSSTIPLDYRNRIIISQLQRLVFIPPLGYYLFITYKIKKAFS